jgi:hypothetical protein
MPVRSASSSAALGCLPFPRPAEPWPNAGTALPSRNVTVRLTSVEDIPPSASSPAAPDAATNEPSVKQSPLNSRRFSGVLSSLFTWNLRRLKAHLLRCDCESFVVLALLLQFSRSRALTIWPVTLSTTGIIAALGSDDDDRFQLEMHARARSRFRRRRDDRSAAFRSAVPIAIARLAPPGSAGQESSRAA